jgi:hypothetical protein
MSQEQEIRELLGWLPSEINCPEKQRFAEAYADAAIVWFKMSQGLRFALFEPFREKYSAKRSAMSGRTRAEVESARRNAARAQLDLRLHVSEHGC